MKKNYIILVLAVLFSATTIAQETQKNFINYQGVARNGADQLMANENMTIGISLKKGSATGASAYAENHTVVTDANGVFSLKIGNGDAVSGAYSTIPWGSEAIFAAVMMNGSEIGTTEMMAVPYALSSGDGSQSATDVPYDNTGSGLAATNAQEAIDELVGSGGVDADADPTNEIQTISFDAATNEINLTDGGTITIPSGGTDADADPANELQTLNFDEGTNELSLSDGNTVTIPSGGADADADPTNELQDISLSGTDLSISEGSTIDLSAIIPPGGTDDQNAVEVPFDNAVSGLTATNTQTAIEELAAGGLVDTDDQDLALSGTLLQITDGAGVDLGPLIPAGGTDDQNLTFDAITNILEIEDGNTVDLSSLAGGGGSSLWTPDANGIRFETGSVGIGTASSFAPLSIDATLGLAMTLTSSGQDNFFTFSNSGGYVGYAGIFSGDNDIDFGTSGTNDTGKVHLTTQASPKLTVTPGGNVGIGTTEPTSTLDVNGDIKTSGEIHGPTTNTANMIPIAYGNIKVGSTIEAGSGNFLVDAFETGRYRLTIPAEFFTSGDFRDYVMIATKNGSPGFISISWIGHAEFIVQTFDISGTRQYSNFNFVIYKP